MKYAEHLASGGGGMTTPDLEESLNFHLFFFGIHWDSLSSPVSNFIRFFFFSKWLVEIVKTNSVTPMTK